MLRRIILGIVVATAAVAQMSPAFAGTQTDPAIERQKAHVVSRMYQATYGAQERCRSSKEASATLNRALDQLRNALPDLMGLIDSSPYLPQAREQFKAVVSNSPITQNDQRLVQECAGIEYMLHQLAETPSGREAANDMIQTLKK